MKNKRARFLCLALSLLTACIAFFGGCGLFGNGEESAVYTIQYADDEGAHTISVKDGELYSLESIPEREGYIFTGLFDAETGGTQYVSESGISLAPFTDKRSLVLYPQFRPEEYTLVLDYQGAAVTGERSLTVLYGEPLPDLPLGLTAENKTFEGWYTQAACGGAQVADAYGVLPALPAVGSGILSPDADGNIFLYAGFSAAVYAVTLHFGTSTEEIEAEYGTPVSELLYQTRNERGEAVLEWSLSQGGAAYAGTVTEDMVLYALTWAPAVEFDTNGGDEVAPLVAPAGENIVLPSPVRENYTFLYWEDESGSRAEFAEMPDESTILTAVWQAMLVFDENGGTEVSDISQAPGTTVSLPSPSRQGYVFAGWYTAEQTSYVSSSMPDESVLLKAGWYEEKTVEKVLISGSDSVRLNTLNSTWTNNRRVEYEVNLNSLTGSDEFMGQTAEISLMVHFQSKSSVDSSFKTATRVFLSRSADIGSSDVYESRDFYSNDSSEWQKHEMTAQLAVENGIVHIIFYVFEESGAHPNRNHYISDCFAEISYPDRSYLYL